MVQSNISLVDLETLIKSNKDKTYITIFTGANADNGHSWCPDCVDAKDTFKQIKEKYSDKFGVYFFYLERPYWKVKTSENEFRFNPLFKVTCLPTLIAYKEGIEVLRLMDDQLFVFDKVEGYLKDLE